MAVRQWNEDVDFGVEGLCLRDCTPTVIEIHGKALGSGGYVVVLKEGEEPIDKISAADGAEVLEIMQHLFPQAQKKIAA